MTTITGLKGSKGETGQADDTRAELNRLDAAVSQIQANISRELDDEINRVQRNGEHRIDEPNQKIAKLKSTCLAVLKLQNFAWGDAFAALTKRI